MYIICIYLCQYSLPKTLDEYVHRAGRTGRLGREGKVITFIYEEEDFVINRHMNELGITIHKRLLKIKK